MNLIFINFIYLESFFFCWGAHMGDNDILIGQLEKFYFGKSIPVSSFTELAEGVVCVNENHRMGNHDLHMKKLYFDPASWSISDVVGLERQLDEHKELVRDYDFGAKGFRVPMRIANSDNAFEQIKGYLGSEQRSWYAQPVRR